MNLWQKLTIDWPCALGDWLWALLVVAPAAWLEQLTWRRARRIALQIAILFVFFSFFQTIITLDLGFLFTLDAASWELIGVFIVLAARGQAIQVARVTARAVSFAVRSAVVRMPRFFARQRRNANALRRKGEGGTGRSDDEPAAGPSAHLGASSLAYA